MSDPHYILGLSLRGGASEASFAKHSHFRSLLGSIGKEPGSKSGVDADTCDFGREVREASAKSAASFVPAPALYGAGSEAGLGSKPHILASWCPSALRPRQPRLMNARGKRRHGTIASRRHEAPKASLSIVHLFAAVPPLPGVAPLQRRKPRAPGTDCSKLCQGQPFLAVSLGLASQRRGLPNNSQRSLCHDLD
jgi:hypothetical protein